MRRAIAAVLVAAAWAAGRADGHGRHDPPNPTPGFVPGAAGRLSFAGVPGLGAPAASRAGWNPVVGSVHRTGLFAHPGTGRTRYTGSFYDPGLGRFGTYRFRQ